MRRPSRLCLLSLVLTVLAAAPLPARAEEPFLVKPFVQLGDTVRPGLPVNALELVWLTLDDDAAAWSMEYRPGEERPWRPADVATARRIAVPGVAPQRVYRAPLWGLVPGSTFSYRVRRAGEVVFSAEGPAPKGADQRYRFVAFGDSAAGTKAQKEIAYQTYRARPDFVMIAGDIVYARGRISEYRQKFWPVYNADQAAADVGAPLLRSTLFVAAPGNHDIATTDLKEYPDGLAYFHYWSQPLNGPRDVADDVLAPDLKGPAANIRAFKVSAGRSYPGMANFSFDYGNAHWTVLDANAHVNWTRPELRSWVERDLEAAKGAAWRFVCFHQPGFNSAKSHFDEQRMRMLSSTFEAGKVDVVFTGHVHNYQRSYPLRFVPAPSAVGRLKGRIDGRWTLDKAFDGRQNTRPNGVIYLVTGAGGAGLYNPEQQNDPGSWQEFTHKFISTVHSLTVADVDGRTLTVRQVSVSGEELDRFVVTK